MGERPGGPQGTGRRECLKTLSATAAASGLALGGKAQAEEGQATQVDKPCLGFKILAAGRSYWKRRSVENRLQFAFDNIEPTDGVIVGMPPVCDDEVHDNAEPAREFGAA